MKLLHVPCQAACIKEKEVAEHADKGCCPDRNGNKERIDGPLHFQGRPLFKLSRVPQNRSRWPGLGGVAPRPGFNSLPAATALVSASANRSLRRSPALTAAARRFKSPSLPRTSTKPRLSTARKLTLS